jgi:hypothetical protein
MRKLLPPIILLLALGCATTPQGRLKQAATYQKLAVDGLGNTYVDVCEQVQKPRCIQKNEESKSTEHPWTSEDRIACLSPCDSETAIKIKTGLDAVVATQLVVLGLLKAGEADEAKLSAARAELAEASEILLKILDETGARDFVSSKLLGK